MVGGQWQHHSHCKLFCAFICGNYASIPSFFPLQLWYLSNFCKSALISSFRPLFSQSLTHVDFKNGNKETTAHSWFAYQGPSTNEVPASVNPADEADEPDDLPVAAAVAAPKGAAAGNARVGTGKKAGRLELSGAWKRVKVENYENFLGAQGANFMQRKLASSLPLVHTFTMSKDLMVFNLTEKGGPIDSNSDFVVGGPAVTTQLAKTQFEDTVTWEDGKLKVVKLKLPEKNYELVTYRWLEDNGNTIHCVRISTRSFS